VPIISSSILGNAVAVRVRYFTDPACSWSWNTEPKVRRLMVEFADSLFWTYVMGGLARDYTQDGGRVHQELLREWLDAADDGGMPLDPRLWTEGPIASTYPACMAVKAAAEQSGNGGTTYLRALREGLFCLRRKLDTTEALVEEARRAGLDVERFRIDLASNAIVEAFGDDLEATRAIPEEARTAGAVVETAGGERLPFPTLAFEGDGRETRWVFGLQSYAAYRGAAVEAGAEPLEEGRPSVALALERFGRLTAAEAAAVCGVPPARAHLELWDLSSEWLARPIAVLGSHLWETA
jgi:predicted DsbA family dithiol-disulfide isomerase